VVIARSIGNSLTTQTNSSPRSANGDVQRATLTKQDVGITSGTKTVANQMILDVPNADDSYFRIDGE
jgi:hypothetical protein